MRAFDESLDGGGGVGGEGGGDDDEEARTIGASLRKFDDASLTWLPLLLLLPPSLPRAPSILHNRNTYAEGARACNRPHALALRARARTRVRFCSKEIECTSSSS